MKAIVLATILAVILPGMAQTNAHDQQDAHAVGVDRRGDHAMGFSHQTTTHHFLLLADGGMIRVETNSKGDRATRDQVRMHLAHIAAMFSNNNFDTPMFIHDRIPPGVPVMKTRRQAIVYTFTPTVRGGEVRIKTSDPDALKAVHEFLRFQIEDHRTGDATEVAGAGTGN